jgi:hypothetical protein
MNAVLTFLALGRAIPVASNREVAVVAERENGIGESRGVRVGQKEESRRV